MIRALAAAAALLLAACASPCLQLAEKLCECEVGSAAQDQCKANAKSVQSVVSITSEDEDRCEALLEGCDCHAIDTPEGKRACGLAR